jgi:hypothetical protein
MWYTRNINAPPVDGRLFIDKRNERLFPQYPAIDFIDNGTSHIYHALNVEARRRLKQGLSFQSTYTWARDVSDGQSENPNDPLAQSGPAQAIPAHRWVNFVIYELPFGKGKRWLNAAPGVVDAVAGGWMFSLVGFLQTGQYLTPRVSMPDPVGITFTTSGNRPLVNIRPDVLRDPNVANPTIDAWFDVGAFQQPPVGRFGTAGVGIIEGPGENLWHAGMYKYFRFPGANGARKLRVELTAVNVFNHPNWANPNVTISSPDSVGRISNVGGPNTGSLGDKGGPRALRLTARLEW